MVAIIDYDAGNMKSVEKAVQYLGEECRITRDAGEIMEADRVILPGVGAFGDAMEKLHRFGLVEVIRQVTAKHTPFLGICLGLQLMFESSDEAPGVEGLGILPGKIVAFPRMALRFRIWDGIPSRSATAQGCFRGLHSIHMCILCILFI